MFGILNIHKPIGLTSRDCVNHIQRIIRPIKCGHAGTLDPLASGVLLIGVGQGVRLVEWMHRLRKCYEASFLWDRSSPSQDTETSIEMLPQSKPFDAGTLQANCSDLIGRILQTPSAYSAIRINGKRAHELIRAGKEINVPTRLVEIFQFQCLGVDYPEVRFFVECGTGTYIRTLGSDLAKKHGTDAVMSRLVRTSIGPFSIEGSIPLDSLSSINDVAENLQDPLLGLATLRSVHLDDQRVKELSQGKRIEINQEFHSSDHEIAVCDSKGTLRGIARPDIIHENHASPKVWRAVKNFILIDGVDGL
jgi:tRNA pseudouridine55 synthase